MLPDKVEALTGTQITEEAQSTMRDAMGFFGTFLTVFAAIGLVVACFTIYNTFQIVVTQRTREMALLRSVGATRAQVLWSQLIEALLLGIVASAFGLCGGCRRGQAAAADADRARHRPARLVGRCSPPAPRSSRSSSARS